MLKFYKSLAILFACGILAIGCQANAQDAKPEQSKPNVSGSVGQVKTPPLKDMGGQIVKTEYFSITIPAGWSMPMPVKKVPQGMSALFGSVKGNLAVTVNVLKAPLSAKEVGNQTLANMRKGGLKTSALKEKNGLFQATVSGKTTGVAWFGGDSKKGIVSAVVILGNDDEKANTLLRALKPVAPGLFPTSVH